MRFEDYSHLYMAAGETADGERYTVRVMRDPRTSDFAGLTVGKKLVCMCTPKTLPDESGVAGCISLMNEVAARLATGDIGKEDCYEFRNSLMNAMNDGPVGGSSVSTNPFKP